MTRLTTFLLSATLAASTCLAADFSYTQRTEITGGSMKQMMGMMGRLAKGMNEPQTSTVHLQGGKMATVSGRNVSIMDAGAGTMTNVDLDKKEFTVITFEEMLAAMKKMSEKMQGQGNDTGAKMSMKVSVDEKGAGKTVVGVPTRNLLMRIDTETKTVDKKSGQEVTLTSTMENDMHIGKTPGSEAFREFAKAMQGKFPMQQIPFQAMMQGGIDMDGMREAGKKMAEIDGMPLYTVTRMINMGMPGMPPPQQQSQGNIQQQDAGRQVANEAATSAIAGRLGRFGGFGRRAANEATKPRESAPPKQQEPAPAAQPAANASNVLMEMTTEVTSVSTDPVDPAVFMVPMGFKEVEHPMKKMTR